MTYDLIIIGGGPAGSATAITAARAGASVLLLERGRFPRQKVCGEFVSAESLALLEDLLSADQRHIVTAAPRISQARVFAEKELRLEIDPPAASITRFDLDRALWQSCLQLGVDTRENSPVRSIAGDGPFTVTAAGEAFIGRAVINAAGRWSFLSSGVTRARAAEERWLGLKAHFFEKAPSPTVDLYFFQGGYCGVQPIGSDGTLNACAMVKAEVASCLEEVFGLHPALHDRTRHWQPVSQPVTTSPLIFHKPEPLQGHMLLVGDAATFVDPFIGDGISLALRSGVLAAQRLAPFFKNQCSLEQAAAEYSAMYSKRLAPVFQRSSMLRHLLRFPSVVRRPAMSLLNRAPRLTREIVRMTR